MRKLRIGLVLLMLLALGLFSGCSSGDGNTTDGDTPDGDDAPDGDAADGDAPDGDDTTDGDAADGDASDGDASDGDTTDGDLADGDVIDGDDTDGDSDADNDLPVDGDEEICVSHASSACDSEDVYWYDSCGNKEEMKEECYGDGCSDGLCIFSCLDGVCLDRATGFEWQETPTGGEMVWSAAITHCYELDLDGGGWRLPNISKLRTLVRNCGLIELGGDCGVTDVCVPCGETACLSDSCWSDANCYPSSCDDDGGPTGCYWPQQLSGTCGWYYSSSVAEDGTGDNWYVGFYDGQVDYDYSPNHVRCVREENCASHASSACDSDDVYWYDSCGNREEKKEECYEDGCSDGLCNFYCLDGVCLDRATGFEWQQTPIVGSMTRGNAIMHCQNLDLMGTGWRLPNISELRTLVRNCDPIGTGGACGLTDVCTPCGDTACLALSCFADANCDPSSCDDDGGPTGCYWPQQLGGTCTWYWSSSLMEEDEGYGWFILFKGGEVAYHYDYTPFNVRCLRW